MKKLILLLMIMSLVSSVNAAVLRYTGDGPWEDATKWTPDNGTTYPGNLPGAADAARMNWGDNTVTVSSAVPTADQVQAGVDESGTLHVLSGGVATSGTWSGAGVAGVCTGTFLIDAGGTLSTGVITPGGGHLWVGMGPVGNFGLVDISGVVNVAGMLGIGTGDGINSSGGIGTVIVREGGELNLSNINPILLGSIHPGSLLDITGTGQVTLPGDFEAVIAAYAAAGRIAGNGVPGAVITDLTTNPGFTTVMVPEPATMSLLALGAIALLRKKK